MEEFSGYKIYITIDENNRVINILSDCFKPPTDTDIFIEQGFGDRFAHAHLYLDKPLIDENGIYQYKYINGSITERTAEEIQADIDSLPQPQPSIDTRVSAMETAVMEMLIM